MARHGSAPRRGDRHRLRDRADARARRPALKTAAIVQSSYVPWKGYFDLVNRADEFIFLDDVQFTRRDWRSRNRIKTPQGLQWLTVPVEVKGKYHQRICDTRIADPGWGCQHWDTLRHNYARAPHFKDYEAVFGPIYLGALPPSLSEVNRRLIEAVCKVLGVATRLSFSMDYAVSADRNQRLVDLCRAVGATRYLSGPSAQAYLDVSRFAAEGIAVEWMDYSGYREYPQLHGPFEHGVTILDLIFNTGPEARGFMRSFPKALHG